MLVKDSLLVKMRKKIFIKTFGCQMNEYDSNRIFDTVKKIGFEKTDKYEEANCYLLNTCHIRDKAKEKVYHEIGRVKKIFRSRQKPIVIVAGCVAQAENQEMLKREPYIDIVIGPQSYHKINQAILNHSNNKKKEEETDFDTIEKFNYLSKIKNKNSKVSSFLTIQEGCDKFCHFCVVPYTRGPEYSRPFTQIIDEAKELIQSGVKEIILLGQNVNAYSHTEKNKEFRLSDLLLELENFDQLERIRYTTSHPKDMTEDLINVYKISNKLMPLVHLPVQSGSNKILKLMNRKHTIEEYLKIYEKLKEINPSIEFSSDFIIGYPEENDDDFNDTMKLIKKINFINSYSFIYSPRPGTVAANLDLVDKKKSKERLEIIQKKLFENQIERNKLLKNSVVNVLVENRMKDGIKLFGRTEYMTSVIFDGNSDSIGKIVQIEITSSNQNSLFGIIKENYKKKVA
jgi:tRNA-2-methylthio-N6-dimethylallyladenosine synthase